MIKIHDKNTGKLFTNIEPKTKTKNKIKDDIKTISLKKKKYRKVFKDVLTKIHGGGATDRKRKLLEKQKKGKARSKQFGRVEIPQEAFIGVLKISKEK